MLSHEKDNTKRKANRNGYKSCSLNTRVSHLLLEKSQIRKFAFQTKLFKDYRRSEKAFLSVICQMVAYGASTSRILKIVDRFSPDLNYVKSTISHISQELDLQIKGWREGQLKDYYVCMIIDPVYFNLKKQFP